MFVTSTAKSHEVLTQIFKKYQVCCLFIYLFVYLFVCFEFFRLQILLQSIFCVSAMIMEVTNMAEIMVTKVYHLMQFAH